MESLSINLDASSVTVKDQLLFILKELTGQTCTTIMTYFMELATSAVNSPSNCHRMRFNSPSGKMRRETLAGEIFSPKVLVIRGYYPNTPISYKLSLFVHHLPASNTVTVDAWTDILYVKKTPHRQANTFKSLVESSLTESMLSHVTYDPPVKQPRILTPTGVKSQPYRRKKGKRAIR